MGGIDNRQNQIDDYVDPIDEQVLRRAHKLLGREYMGDGHYYEIDDALEEAMKKAREQILEELKFEQAYKQTRHVGQIEEEQRLNDASIVAHNSERDWDKFKLEKDVAWEEQMTVRRDIGDIHPNDIVESYRRLAEYYNMKDDSLLADAIAAPDKPIDVASFVNSIKDPAKKEELQQIVQQHNNNITPKALASILQGRAKTRIDTVSSFVGEVASNDITSRTQGVQQKTDALNHFVSNSKTLNSEPLSETATMLETRKKNVLSLADIREATATVSMDDVQREKANLASQEKDQIGARE